MRFVQILLLGLAYASCAQAAVGNVYYSDTVKNIIAQDCSRCHSGATRNLMDYDQVKAYVDSGLLRAMVSPGGPMSRHAGNDGQTILAWIDQGGPEKPGTQLAQMTVPTGGKANPGTGVYYSDTVKNIIAQDCSRCHSGATRNLMDYDQVKAYVDSGLLRAMVSPGGPMSRHAGNDGQTILAWIDQGSPEKPGAQLARMTVPTGGQANPGAGVYYSDTIKNIIAQDCGRCHSGATRNLMDYDQVKAYVDSGLLRAMVSPGGPMSRHAGNDGQTILKWIDQGAPEKPMKQLAQMTVPTGAKANPGTGVYYSDTIKNIVARDCGRCHSGPVRNFMTYDKLKAYAASGLLKAMVSPGGAMNGMAGSDAPVILAWIAQGSPEKPGVQLAQMIGPGNGIKPFELTVPIESMTYDNTIKFVLAKDCLECHSGQFRNLTTYAKVKYYVDNGLLRLLVSRGGQMHRFAGPDSRLLLQWAAKGAPQ